MDSSKRSGVAHHVKGHDTEDLKPCRLRLGTVGGHLGWEKSLGEEAVGREVGEWWWMKAKGKGGLRTRV